MADINVKGKPTQGGYSNEEIEKKWLELTDIPFDEAENGELILAVNWWIFKQGTSRDDIWHFFDVNHKSGIAYLLYDY